MATDEALPIRSDSDDVFEIGERTIFRLKSQESVFDADDLGTMIVRPKACDAGEDTRAPLPPPAEALTRIEGKLDALARTLESIQRRLDAIEHQPSDAPANAPSR
jgi:hypothetical protein